MIFFFAIYFLFFVDIPPIVVWLGRTLERWQNRATIYTTALITMIIAKHVFCVWIICSVCASWAMTNPFVFFQN